MEITKKYANSDSPYKERIKQNDEEIAAIQYFGKKNMNIMKIGLDAIDGDENGNKVKNIHNVPRKIRNIPDFIVIKEDKSIFLECKKCGDNFKPKMNELESYKWWNNLHPDGVLDVYFFIYNFDKIYIISIKSLVRLINENDFKTDKYDKNNEPYYIIPKNQLTLTGQDPINFTIENNIKEANL